MYCDLVKEKAESISDYMLEVWLELFETEFGLSFPISIPNYNSESNQSSIIGQNLLTLDDESSDFLSIIIRSRLQAIPILIQGS